MAKETKQDRIVRGIFDQVTEHLHEIKGLEASGTAKELDVERWAQSFLKNCLGYTASSGYVIKAQEAKGKMRPDLIVLHGDKPKFVVEIKKLGFDLSKSDFRSGKVQLKEYLNQIGDVRWGILTNGIEWRLYDFSQVQYGGIEISSCDLRSDGDVIDTSKRAVDEQCYELLDFHESSLVSSAWDGLAKEALAFSPESLAKAILSADVVRIIAKQVRGEHEYKADREILSDKIYDLLSQGLDDSIQGWNETKALELQKYIKSQKRAARKVRRIKTSKQTDSAVPVTAGVEAAASEVASVTDGSSTGSAA
ncbi:MAG: type I restriction enzyme HsdR N-terminal domain-containing protein [Deltaproteobacteria bacterium]|nr:type I restriction enzyme HsdR N-terminal domain-containing protein [Deltaproteobacteria bacterium]